MPNIEEDLRQYSDRLTDRVLDAADAPFSASVISAREHRRPAVTRRYVRAFTAACGIAAAMIVSFYVAVQLDRSGDQGDDLVVQGASEQANELADGEWVRYGGTAEGLSSELSPSVFDLGSDKVLILTAENGGEDLSVEVLDMTTGDVMRAAPSNASWRADPLVVWTGRFLVIVGGENDRDVEPFGVAYDPVDDSWSSIAAPPGAETTDFVGSAAWTGDELVAWRAGYAYDPDRGTWRDIADPPIADRHGAAVASVPGGMIVWGGCDSRVPRCEETGTSFLEDGVLYDAAADAWHLLPKAPLESAPGAVAVLAGSRVIVVVPGADRLAGRSSAALDLDTMLWTPLPGLPAEAPYDETALVWTGRQVLVWGGYVRGRVDVTNAGFALDPSTAGPWKPVAEGGSARRSHAAAWTTRGLVISGGYPTATTEALTLKGRCLIGRIALLMFHTQNHSILQSRDLTLNMCSSKGLTTTGQPLS